MSIRRNLSILVLACREQARRFANRLRRNAPSRLLAAGSSSDRLILAPQDLRTPDSASAMEIYSGRFFLAGKMVDCTGEDPFRKTDAPLPWQAELHAFGWLRHLEAEGSALTKSNAQILVNDWLNAHGRKRRGIAWHQDIPARRLISWICHSVPIVEASTPRFYQQWLKAISLHIRHLKYRVGETDDGLPTLNVRIALAYAAICVSGQERNLRNAARFLDRELASQVLPDGHHVSRNPAYIIDILALLLPLRQSYARLGLAPSQTLISTIDRMMAALKFFQMGDGTLARFNGVSVARPDLAATIRFYDDSLGTAPENAGYGGYQRLALGDTILVCDTGAPPTGQLSRTCSAGTLSLEMSSGNTPILVNCGTPNDPSGELAVLSRSTAAHSTATINDTSSSRIYRGRTFSWLLEGMMVSSPRNVICHREDGEDFKQFSASHDGYRHAFGILHKRRIAMRDEGNRIEGSDEFHAPGKGQLNPRNKADYAIRFHLHPSVSAGISEDGNSVVLICGGGLIWKLTCIDCPPRVEESLFMAAASGPKRSRQIVLSASAHDLPEIRWLLTRERNPADPPVS